MPIPVAAIAPPAIWAPVIVIVVPPTRAKAPPILSAPNDGKVNEKELPKKEAIDGPK